MTRMRLGVALVLLVLATASCGRYGPPVRASRPAAAPAAQIPADPASNQPTDETVEP